MKLVVEVEDASDLMPKDGSGSANPFVEVDFDGQRHHTQTKLKDLNPSWNERLTFNVDNPADLPHQTIDVTVYNDRKTGGHHKNFLGRVRISGASVPVSDSESAVQRYPLDKRGIFSHIRGDIALKIYAVHDNSPPTPPVPNRPEEPTPPLDASINGGGIGIDIGGASVEDISYTKKKNKNSNKEKETQTWHSIGKATPPAPPVFEFMKPPAAAAEEKRADKADYMGSAPMTVQQMQMLPKQPEFGLIETAPPLPGRLRRYRGDKTASTYDLVEQMLFLYVNVVKAKDLPVMDITGSLDPYVEVKVGNYKGVTKVLEKNQNPVWHQVFAFPKERLQTNLIDVTVKDKDYVKDDFVGRVCFERTEVPLRVPPDSPLAPLWYKLEDKKGDKAKGEVMLAVWMGTQADEAFPIAWHADAHDLSVEGVAQTRSQVYYSPKLYYLRVHVIEAQDLVPAEKGRVPEAWVRVQLDNQVRYTRPSLRTTNPTWDDELMFVAAEPLVDFLVVTVEDRLGPSKTEPMGRKLIPLSAATTRLDQPRLVESRWYPLERPSLEVAEVEKKKEVKFASRIQLSIILEAGYHVLDESTYYSSDLQPAARTLRKPMIGILELGILNAKGLVPMKSKEGRTCDAYCVAKYGSKWVRTRTALDTLAPRWHEQYTWEVHDPCTVITIGVFDNCQLAGKKEGRADQRIGKVRIRLSTLDTDRIYTHYYPLLLLQPSGLKKMGELHLAIRFTCVAWMNMMTLYSRPLLPKMHYVRPISIFHVDFLRRQAIQIVWTRLGRAEPPLRREVVEYLLDVDSHMWSLRRSKAIFFRIQSVLSGVAAVGRWFDDVRNWKNPITTCLVHVLFFILVCYPELILPTVFLYLFMIGIWNYRYRPREPTHMDVRLSFADRAHPDELDEEFDTFPTSRPGDVVRMRYDRLRSVAGRIQTVAGDLATQGERALNLLSWRDPRATAIFILFALILAVILYVTPFQVLALIYGLYLLRHPRFRSKLPSVPFNFYRRLPSKSDMLI